MATVTRAAPDAISTYVHLVRWVLRQLPPVQADVWQRLLYRMLPVNCRFAYLQVTRPDAICCAYKCGAVETDLHAFSTCPKIHPIWAFHARAWRVYGVDFAWTRITQLGTFTVNDRGHLLTAAVIYLIWTRHNKVQYEDHNKLPTTAWEELTYPRAAYLLATD
ncbi:hypothetical protein ACHHYP_06536 [Achlya hypogyna]|uniref:Reverse transcriptase zinc-binding domain-containing protein n=1 Tax=Achlya hypogyna TaxID=1202772 RepID=A0A1V9YT56_ACHHY|nr:hypothetical protein ACHHYP_06536 [Achlya hypogyna]